MAEEFNRKYNAGCEKIQKSEVVNCYNRNFHWILEEFCEDLRELTQNGQTFNSMEVIRPIELVKRDIGGTFEKAAKDIGFVCSLSDGGKSAAYFIYQRLTVPVPEKGKPKSIAQMMIWGNK